MNRPVRIFRTPREMAESFASDLVKMVKGTGGRALPFTIALSGGRTPELLFRELAETYGKSTDWHKVHFFWGDERCVPPDNSESNYRKTRELFLDKIDIPVYNIHRIRGEENPEKEALRYSEEISAFTVSENGFPKLDVIILGMGNDGHTASIFPENLDLIKSNKVCEVSVHPVTGQKRVTLTGKVINNAGNIVFMVTGTEKAHIIRDIFNEVPESKNYPASFIIPANGEIKWLLDEKAGEYVTSL